MSLMAPPAAPPTVPPKTYGGSGEDEPPREPRPAQPMPWKRIILVCVAAFALFIVAAVWLY